MRVGFRERPSDLLLVAGLAAVLSAVSATGLGGLAGFAVGFVLVLLLPGYAIMAALFPAAGDVTWLQRVTLSVGLSIAAVSLAGLLSNFAPWGIHVGAILLLLDVLTLGACTVAYARRSALPAERRLGLSVEIGFPRWTGLSSVERLLVVLLAAALALAGGWTWYAASRFVPPPGFTEFALLNESGQPGGYPTSLVVGELATVIIVVVNHESATINYTIEIWLVTFGSVYNASSGQNETVEVSNVMAYSFSSVLGDSSMQRTPYTFHIDQVGSYALRFFLYRGPPGSESYRSVRLNITVA